MEHSFSFEPSEEPPPMKPGDSLTVVWPGGKASLVITHAEPIEDEDGNVGQSIRFLRWPGE